MQTLSLPNIILEIHSASLSTNNGMMPENSPQQLVVSGVYMFNSKHISHFNQSFILTQKELDNTVLSSLEDLALEKVKAELGITA